MEKKKKKKKKKRIIVIAVESRHYQQKEEICYESDFDFGHAKIFFFFRPAFLPKTVLRRSPPPQTNNQKLF